MVEKILYCLSHKQTHMQLMSGKRIHYRTTAIFLAAIIIVSIVAGYENWVTATTALHAQWTDELNDVYMTRQNLLEVWALLKYNGNTLDKNQTVQDWIQAELMHASPPSYHGY